MPPTVFVVAAVIAFIVGLAHTRLRLRLLTRGTKAFARVTAVAQYANQSYLGLVWPADIEFLDQNGHLRTSVIAVWSFELGGLLVGRPGHIIGKEFGIIHDGASDIEVCRVWPVWLLLIAFLWVRCLTTAQPS
jgi:hypothetical protein